MFLTLKKMKKVEIEICLEEVDIAILADQSGAKRIELCSALDLGGLTPSFGLIQTCVAHCDLDVFVMIRPRGGDFVYSPEELTVMEQDLVAAKNAGAHGVVFGCLTEKNELDLAANRTLIKKAKELGLGTTFHRAFDFCSQPEKSLLNLIDIGFDRLLTSGQKPRAIDGIDLIKKLVVLAEDRIQVMAGSGVNPENASILSASGIQAIHFTARKPVNLEDPLNMGLKYIPDPEKIKQIIHAIH